MKPRFRQSMNWLHTWGGLSCGWLLYFMFITGSAGYFENEIDRWMKPEMSVIKHDVNQVEILKGAEDNLNKLAAAAPQWYITYPTARAPFVNISWLEPANKEKKTLRKWHVNNIDIHTAEQVEVRETAGGMTLYRMHYNLHYVPKVLAYWVTSLAAMLMLIGLVTGVVIHKKIFVEFFTFRANKGRRSWLDIHNIFSVLPLPFHLMITYSGLMLLMTVTLSTVVEVSYGDDKINEAAFLKKAFADATTQQISTIAPENLSLQQVLEDVSKRHPHQQIHYIGVHARHTPDEHIEVWFNNFDGIEMVSSLEYSVKNSQVIINVSHGKEGAAARFYDVLMHLHEGLFADIYLRWLYFISGLLGAGMIATGMILWAGKQRKNSEQKDRLNAVAVIERLNIGMIVGIPIAIAGYFWSNRLLPANMLHRPEWEVNCLFITLAICVGYCIFRPTKKAWHELLWLAAVLYLLLPIVNGLTTGHHFVTSLKNSDWLMFGFDVSVFCFGFIFAIAAILFKKYRLAPVAQNLLGARA